MATQRDITLAIRAKDEASRALEQINRTIGDLIGANRDLGRSGEQASTGLAASLQTFLALDKAVAQLTGKFDAAQSGLAAQAQAVATTSDRLAAVRGQMAGAATAAERLRVAIVDALVNGGDANPLRDKLRTAESAMQALQSEATRLQATLAKQKSGYVSAGEAARSLEANVLAVTAAQRAAREESERVAAAAERQAKASTVRPTIERATGITRDRGDLDALHAQLRQESQRATEQEAAAIKRLRDELNPLAVVEARVAAETAKLNEWQARGEITAQEHAKALGLLHAEADRTSRALARGKSTGRTNFLGLEPYQLQNLSFQINDVFTQLASGTSLMQTLGQQGGQIVQIFPRVGAAIARGLTSGPIMVAVAAFGALVLAIKEAGDQAERLRTFNAALAASADGASHSAERLNDAAKGLKLYGLSAEDAVAAVRTFTREGVDDSRLAQFGQAAADTAAVMGGDLKQAAKDVADAFTGGYAAVTKLDDAYNFLTVAQREQIRALFDEGKAGEARNLALNLYSEKMGDAAEKQRGPWASAARELGAAWREMLGALGDTSVISGAVSGLATFADNLAMIIRRLRGASTEADLVKQIAGAQGNIATLETLGGDKNPFMAQARERLRLLQEQLRVIQQQNAAQPGSDPKQAGAAADAKRAADAIRTLTAEEELQRLRDKSDAGLTVAESRRRAELAGQIAYNREIEASGNAQVAQKQRELALERERTQIAKQNAQAAKSTAAERERAIKQFESRVIGAEGGAGKNPFSSAAGFGQFLEATWLGQFRKVFADEAGRLAESQILALRRNKEVAQAIIGNYARENAKFLESFGAKVTAGNLYLAHFLGPAGARKVLQADPNTPVDRLLSDKVLTGNRGYLYTGGRARTAGELRGFIASRVGDTDSAQTAGQVAINGLIEEGRKRQDEFNLSVQQANEERQRQIDALTTESQLQGAALIEAQRRAAVDKAEFDLRQRIAEMNRDLKPGEAPVQLSDDQVARTRELAAAEYDLAHARELAQARTSDAERRMVDLTAERDAIRQQIDALRAIGDTAAADALLPKLQGVNGELRSAIDQAIAFYAALDPATDPLHRTQEQINAVIAGLKAAQTETVNWVSLMGISGQQIADVFASGATSALDRFAQAVAEGKNVFASLGDAFRSFAADFLRQIAQMIQRQIVFNLVARVFGSIGGGISGVGSVMNANASIFHTGGVAGAGAPSRGVSPAWFTNALRYHSGGIAGLRPNEVPAILQRGEEVLTRDDTRHRANGGMDGGSQPKVDLKIVNTIDAAEMVSEGLATRAGQQAFLNMVRANRRGFREAMG